MEMFLELRRRGVKRAVRRANALGAGARFAPLRSPGWEGVSETSAKLPKGRPSG